MKKGVLTFLTCLTVANLLFGQIAKPFFYGFYADFGLASDKTTCVYQDSMGFIWIGTQEGLTKLNGYYEPINFLSERGNPQTISNNRINAIVEDQHNNLWIGTDNGLNRYDREKDTFVRYTSGFDSMNISGQLVSDLVLDSKGNLWIATNKGINRYHPTSNRIVKSFEGSDGGLVATEFIRTIEIDHNDFLWVASNNGLYKGENAEFVKSNIEASNYTINVIESTASEKLWFGFNGQGVMVYDQQTQMSRQFRHHNSQDSLINDFVNDITVTVDEKVWISTRNGISVSIPKSNSFISHQYHPDQPYSLGDYIINHTFEDNVGLMWFATETGGISIYHEADNQFKHVLRELGNANTLADNHVLSLLEDANEDLWIGSRHGLTRLDYDHKYHHYLNRTGGTSEENNHVLSMELDGKGNLWLGTSKGLSCFHLESKRYTNFYDSELNDQINVVLFDHNNRLWVGTDSNGILHFNPSIKELDQSIYPESNARPIAKVNTIIEDRDNTIWIGTATGVFYYESGQSHIKPLYFRDENGDVTDLWVNHFFEAKDGKIWGGSRTEGLFQIMKEDKSLMFHTKETGLIDNSINTIVGDAEGNLWISSNSGLMKMEIVEGLEPVFNNYTYADGLQGTQFVPNSGTLLKNGSILFGGFQGLTAFDPSKIISYEYDLPVVLNGLKINHEFVEVGGADSVLSRHMSLTESIALDHYQNDVTIEFIGIDYLRPDSVKYQYKLEGHDDDWKSLKFVVNTAAAVYTNLPGGKEYTFQARARSRFTNWNESKPLSIYIRPAFHETIWFKFLIVILIIVFVFLIYQIRVRAIRSKNEKLSQLVAERTSALNEEIEIGKKKERELQIAKEQAETANRTKSQFLANMSHEMRTPLNGIVGLTSVLSKKPQEPEQKRFLKSIEDSAISLKNLISDLLDISKIEAGKLEINNEEFQLDKLIGDALSIFEIEASAKQLSLKYHLEPDLCVTYIGDYQRIQQILFNLISNAIKFTISGGISLDISKTTLEDEDYIHFRLSDTGVGIPENEVDRIFETFAQADNSPSIMGGTGLGLSICKQLIEKMGGRMWVESEVNVGSTFHFQIKLERKDIDKIVLEQDPETNLDIEMSSNTEAFNESNGRILLAEDNELNQLVAQQLLKTLGFESDVVPNGEKAIDALKSGQYLMVLMDAQMPIMNGYDATRAIRNSVNETGIDNQIPIIAVTAYALEGDREKCLSAGMNDYVSKPLTIESLKAVMDNWLPETVN